MNDDSHNVFSDVKLLNIVNDYNLFSILIDARYLRTSTNILGLEKAESFIVNRRFNKKYIGIIEKYTSFIYKKFLENPYIIFDSRIFDYEAFSNYFDKDQLKNILDFYKKVSSEYSNVLKNIKNVNKIKEEHLRFAIGLIGKNDDITDATYRYLINNYSHNHSLLAQEFIVKYTAYLAGKELDVSYDNIYYNSYNFLEGTEMDCQGIYDTEYGYIFVNNTYNKDPLKLVQTISHEMKHRKQFDLYRNEVINLATFQLFTRCAIKADEKDDEKNYVNDEIEIDANDYGWDLTARIFSIYTDKDKCVKDALNRKNEFLLQKAVNYKYGNDYTNCIEDITYNIEKLDKIAKKTIFFNNQYMNFLDCIYYGNGNRKPFTKLVLIENNLLKEDKDKYSEIGEIFDMFYLYDIGRMNNMDIDFEDLSEEHKLIIINRLIDLAMKQIYDIHNITTLTKLNKYSVSYRPNAKTKIIIKRLRNILNILNNNKQYIFKLGNNVINTKIEKLSILLEGLNIKLDNNIFNNIFYTKNTYELYQSGYKLKKSIC